VRTAMKGCDAVLHLAALIAIPYSYHSPDTYVDTNIKGTLNIVQAARDLGVSKVVHTRSTRPTRCRASRPTRRARSARTRSRCPTIFRSGRPWACFVRSTPMVPASPRGR
jgi:nucleoside-diphosphate-sugar epimerase